MTQADLTSFFDEVAVEVIGRYSAVHVNPQAKRILRAVADKLFHFGWNESASSTFANHRELHEILRISS